MDLSTVFECIDQKELTETVGSLIRIPSHLEVPDQEKEVSAFVAQALNSCGIAVEEQEVTEGRKNVIAKIGGNGAGKSLTLNGHIDTVPPGEGMKQPYVPEIRDGRLYGRGSCDMKGAVGAMMYVLRLIKERGISLEGDLFFTAVVGEETGGTGTRYLTEHGFRTDFAVVGEPTDLKIVTSHKGVCNIKVTVRGRSCHGSVPEQGSNAIVAVSDIIQEIKKQLLPKLKKRTQEHVGSATMNFGMVEGGTKINMVADRCTLQIDRRWIEGETLDMVKSEVEDIAKSVCDRDDGLSSEVQIVLPEGAYFGPLLVPGDHEFTKTVTAALKENGMQISFAGMQGWTDAATLFHSGVPVVVLGPGSIRQAHTDDEYVEVGHLVDAVKCYLSIINEVCGMSEG
ncbi:MAG TPA: M20 family metallopeptidase [Spirochaetota bacterium]|nr:M20 family metallopeptidase [Spirochaetota bacterium]